ncbi:inner centromere protein isoform X2 [Anolis carolinensis]|uniref:inner centromere protein-like isoform X2 n=1 Tax=Anolis carolinensis TaxID=28377 RepID=UPI002F2B2E93
MAGNPRDRAMPKMVSLMRLEEESQNLWRQLLDNVDKTDFLWMEEILEEAQKMFSSSFNGKQLLMPKTPSQKNRQKKSRISSAKHDQFVKKRLSKRNGNQASLQHERDLTIFAENISPCCRVTRSRAARSARTSENSVQKATVPLAKGRIALVEISANERHSAELHFKKTPPPEKKVSLSIPLSSQETSTNREQPLSRVSLIVIPDTPEAQIKKEGRGASKLKIANGSIAKTTKSKEPITDEKTACAQQQENCQPSDMEVKLNLSEDPWTPRVPKEKRQSVRRSLMGRPSLKCSTSLVARCSLSAKRKRAVQKSMLKRKASQQSSSASGHPSSPAAVHSEDEETATESTSELDPSSDSQGHAIETMRTTPNSQKASMTANLQAQEDPQKGEHKVGSPEKSEEIRKPSQNVGRQASYKRALGDLEDEQEKLSPPRKKVPSPYLASKVVRPFKTFLHTVQKNQMLMGTPSSVSRSCTVKSFLKQNTPLRTTPQEKEKQRLENLRKKEEAEKYRKQKLEEQKRKQQEEMRRKREERLRKVQQARERAEQMEEEKKKRLEQKLAQHEEKNEKVREEKLAEDKVKKKVAAKKLEEIEARRKQDEEARKQKALQLEEEERRHRELMQKRKEEEEQEKARKAAEQRQAELEREKNLAAERELQKKKEQEKLRAQREYERQEKEKVTRLQKEVIAAAKEKERLRKEEEENERKRKEQLKQEEEQKAAEAKTASKQLNVTVDIQNSPCNSYEMTPQSHKHPKVNIDDYGMDLNSDDSTDDESRPRKPIPAWASGNQLTQAVMHQYYNPSNVRRLFGVVKSPNLEEIFYKSKPRYFKRTSSAVWNSPPFPGGKSVSSNFKRW